MKYVKFCKICGKEFEATHGNQKLCTVCKKNREEERRLNNINKTNTRVKELGMRSTLLYAKDIELLKSIKKHGDTLADAFHKIFKIYIDITSKS